MISSRAALAASPLYPQLRISMGHQRFGYLHPAVGGTDACSRIRWKLIPERNRRAGPSDSHAAAPTRCVAWLAEARTDIICGHGLSTRRRDMEISSFRRVGASPCHFFILTLARCYTMCKCFKSRFLWCDCTVHCCLTVR